MMDNNYTDKFSYEGQNIEIILIDFLQNYFKSKDVSSDEEIHELENRAFNEIKRLGYNEQKCS